MKMYGSGISVHSSEQEAAKALFAFLKYNKYLEKAAPQHTAPAHKDSY